MMQCWSLSLTASCLLCCANLNANPLCYGFKTIASLSSTGKGLVTAIKGAVITEVMPVSVLVGQYIYTYYIVAYIMYILCTYTLHT